MNRGKEFKWLGLFLSIIIIALFGGSTMGLAQTKVKPILIGRIDLYTGPPALQCEEGRMALEMIAEEVNATGGLLGRTVKFLYRDVKNPEEAIRAARDLVTIDKADVIIGSYSSAIVLALSAFAKENKVLLICHAGKSSALTEELGHRYVFRTDSNTIIAGRILAQVFVDRKLPYKKIYTSANDYEYGHKFMEAFIDRLKVVRPDIEIIGQVWPPFASKDYTPYISTILGAKPDALVTLHFGTDTQNFVKAGNALGLYPKIPVVACMGASGPELVSLGKEQPMGILASSEWAFYYPLTPENKAFVDKFKVRYKRVPLQGAYFESTAMEFYKEAVKKAGSTDTEEVINALEGLTILTPGYGKLTMRAYDHQVNRGEIWGITTWSDEHKFAILKDCKQYAGDPFMHTVDEVKAIRGKK